MQFKSKDLSLSILTECDTTNKLAEEKEIYYCYLNIMMNNNIKKYIVKDFVYLQHMLKF